MKKILIVIFLGVILGGCGMYNSQGVSPEAQAIINRGQMINNEINLVCQQAEKVIEKSDVLNKETMRFLTTLTDEQLEAYHKAKAVENDYAKHIIAMRAFEDIISIVQLEIVFEQSNKRDELNKNYLELQQKYQILLQKRQANQQAANTLLNLRLYQKQQLTMQAAQNRQNMMNQYNQLYQNYYNSWYKQQVMNQLNTINKKLQYK